MTNFKRAGITAAVAAATASFVSLSNAQIVSEDNLGDLAIVPYYTVENGLRTGIHIINTTSMTQVVKYRMRRGSDSADALDFNIVLSPQDVWVATILKDGDVIRIATGDESCTVPGKADLIMPESVVRDGAEEGYIEIIGMGQAAVTSPIGIASKHGATGLPADCAGVISNFLRVPTTTPSSNGNPAVPGTHDYNLTANGKPVTGAASGNCVDASTPNECGLTIYESTDDRALKVSWFVRDPDAGLEFGGNAVHIEGFSANPMMTNQVPPIIQDGALQFDPLNFELPNLDGGPYDFNATLADFNDGMDSVLSTKSGSLFGLYNPLRDPAVLGRAAIANDWSSRVGSDFTVATDWIVTMPGQYLMVDWATLNYVGLTACKEFNPTTGTKVCDQNDLPVQVGITAYDREELGETFAGGGVGVSPGGRPGETPLLDNEVNVIQWAAAGQDGETVLGESTYGYEYTVNSGATNGWAKLNVSKFGAGTSQIFYPDPNDTVSASGAVPIIGFAAWARVIPANPNANYGRAVDHSYTSN